MSELVQPGTVLAGSIRIVRAVDSDDVASVFEAEDTEKAGVRLTVKVLRTPLGRGEEIRARFAEEVALTTGLAHPNLLAVSRAGLTEGGCPFFATELVQGHDLAEELRKTGRLSPARTLSIAKQIAWGLSHAHGKGLVHRDLGPDKVLLVAGPAGPDHPVVKVRDFGIARWRRAARLPGAPVYNGTPEYMAPEQALGKPDEGDRATDQFALAAMVYELLTGRKAFRNPVELETAPPPTPASLVEGIDELAPVVMRALSKARQNRYPSVMHFAWALEEAVKRQATRPATPAPSELARPAPTPGREVSGPAARSGRGAASDSAPAPIAAKAPGSGPRPAGRAANGSSQPARAPSPERTQAQHGSRPVPQTASRSGTSTPARALTPRGSGAQDGRQRRDEAPATAVAPSPSGANASSRPVETGPSAPAPAVPPPIGAPAATAPPLMTMAAPVDTAAPAPLDNTASPAPVAPHGADRRRTTLSTAALEGPSRPNVRRRIRWTVAAAALGVVAAGGLLGAYLRRPGTVLLDVVPSDAIVTLDGEPVRQALSAGIQRPAGPHRITIARPGYLPRQVSLEVSAGATTKVEVRLDPAPDTGFEISSDPPGQRVWLDGEPLTLGPGSTEQAVTNFRALAVAPGRHRVEIKGNDAFQSWQHEFVQEPGQIASLHATLVSTCAIGSLRSTPPAKVYVDGKDTGLLTPLLEFSVDCGPHEIMLVSSDLSITRTYPVSLQPGERLTQSYDLTTP